MSKVSKQRVYRSPQAFPSTNRIFQGDFSQQADEDSDAGEILGHDVVREGQKSHAADSRLFVIKDN